MVVGTRKLGHSVIDPADIKVIEMFPTFIRITFRDGGSVELHATLDGTIEVT